MRERGRAYHTGVQKKASSECARERERGNAQVSSMGKGVLLLILSALLLFAGFGFFSGLFPAGTSVVEANEQLGELQYKVIEIQKGDSLWSIAEAYMNPGFHDIYEYISEVKRCNQLDSNRIIAGNYLMIPYYEGPDLK